MLHPCRTALRIATALLLLVLGLATAARGFGVEPGPVAWVVAMTPWVGVACVVALVPAALSSSRILLAVALALVAVQVAWQLPLYLPDHRVSAQQIAGDRAAGGAATIMTLNLHNGTADPAAVVRLVKSSSVAVLALEELTPTAVVALRAAGLDRALPYSYRRPADGATGTGLWSRTALTGARDLPGFFSHQLLAETTLAGQRVTVAAVHPIAPGPLTHEPWSGEYQQLTRVLGALTGPVVVAGDFNATWDQAPFRGLLATGFTDAADQAGAGVHFTYPEGAPWPPLVAIDHVLSKGFALTAVALRSTAVRPSDHAAVIVDYAAP